MKKKAYYLLSLITGMVFLLASCEELDTPYNTVPRLSEVSISPNSKMELNYTLSHEGKNANSGYYEISQYADMHDALRQDASNYTGYWRAEVDLLPSTTYYIRLVLTKNKSSVSGPVTEYTTGGINNNVTVSSVTTNSAYFSFYWNRTDCKVIFQYSTSEDMSYAETLTALHNYSYSAYYNTVKGLTEYQTYYVRACIYLPNGTTYYSPVTQFKTSKTVTISTTGSNLSGNARFWIVGENSTTGGTGVTWKGNVSEPSDIYIFKPVKNASNYKEIPITYNEFERFEYGSGKIDPTSSENVYCSMKSWLAYNVTLNISIKSTNGATSSKYISYVEIANNDKADAISTNAKFDLTTGILTPVKNNAAKWSQSTKIPLSYPKSYDVTFLSLIPTKFNEGEVKVNIVLNNSTNMTTEVYPATLKADSWEQGKKYSYPITVNYTLNDVEITVGDVTVTPWKNDGNDTNIDIYD